jgi:hypothetical protein
MVNNKISEEHNLTFDERRKELNQKKSQISEFKTEQVLDDEGKVIKKEKLMSTVNQSMTVTYTEEGIRRAYKDLSEERSFLENQSAKFKKQFEGQEEMSDELKELKEKIKQINKFKAIEQAKSEYENAQNRLNEVKKDIKEIQEAIGTRLKL